MIEHDKQSARSLEEPTPVEPENFQAAAGRRRFLKGLGIGLPAVMTLYHGAILANGSSLKCLDNRTGDPLGAATDHLTTQVNSKAGDYVTSRDPFSGADMKVDVRTYDIIFTDISGNPSVYKTYEFYWDPYGTSPGTWRTAIGGIDTQKNSETDLDSYVNATYVQPLGSQYSYKAATATASSYAYAYIADDGAIKALGPISDARVLPAQLSCWASFHPGGLV